MQSNLSPIDRDMLIRTVIGEAANEPLKGQAGVVYSVLNRMTSGRYGGSDAQSVIFKKHAYEPWTKRRSELLAYKPESDSYKRAAGVVDAVLGGQIKDPTGGATHFLNPKVVEERRGGSLPKWAQGEGTPIGRHTFFAPDGAVQQVADRRAVTDPAILEALGSPEETPAATSQTGGPVTDPDILKALELPGVAPPVASGVPGVEATIAEPILPGREVGMGGAFIQGFTSNEQEGLRALAQSLYPDEPVDQAVQRFGKEGGTLYHVGDDGQRYRVNPEGWSIQQVLNQVAAGSGPLIPALTGAAVGAATAPAAMAGPVGLAASLAATGTAAGGGEYLRQKAGDLMMGEASTGEVSPLQVMSEAGSSIAGQGAGALTGAVRTRAAVRDIAQHDPQATQRAYQQAENVGLGGVLTPAEATGLPTLAAQQKRLVNNPITSNAMRAFLDEGAQRIKTRWQDFLGGMSPAADAEDVGRLTRTAAQGVFADMGAARQAASRPFYEVAFAEGDRALWSPELERLTSAPSVLSAMQGAVRSWRDKAIADGFGAMNPGANVDSTGIMKFTGGKLPAFPNLQFWDYTKRILDDQVKTAIKAGKTDKVRTLTRLTQALRSELDDLAPGEYAKARSIWGTGSEDIASAMESAMGILAETKDVNLLQAAQTIFNPRTRSPAMVARLRIAISGKDPNAWQAIKRLYMQDVTTDALRIAETGDVLNPAGKIHKAFMNDRVQGNLQAALSPDEWKEMQNLLVVFKRASSVPGLRSDTAFIQSDLARQKDAARSLSIKLMIAHNASPLQWRKNIESWLENRVLDRHAEQVTKLITSGDPRALETMKELRRLSPLDKRWIVLFGHLLGQGGASAFEVAMPEPDFAPSGGVGGGGYQ